MVAGWGPVVCFAVEHEHSAEFRTQLVWFATSNGGVHLRHDLPRRVASLYGSHPASTLLVFVLLRNTDYLHREIVYFDDGLSLCWRLLGKSNSRDEKTNAGEQYKLIKGTLLGNRHMDVRCVGGRTSKVKHKCGPTDDVRSIVGCAIELVESNAREANKERM